MKEQFRTSVRVSEEDQLIADSIAEADERNKAWVFEKALHNGLPSLDTEKAQAIRAKKGITKKGKK